MFRRGKSNSLPNKKNITSRRTKWFFLLGAIVVVGMVFMKPENVLDADASMRQGDGSLLQLTAVEGDDNSFQAKKGNHNSQTELPLCDRDQIRLGEWKPRQYDRLPFLPRQLDTKMCYNEADLQRPWNTYEWHPSAAANNLCGWTEWNVNSFCDVAYNQTIAFLGDSLTLEQYSTLIHTLGVTDFTEESTFENKGPTKFSYNVCPHNTTRLFLYRNNFLWLRGVKKVLLEEYPLPDVVVMNRGSWYQSDEDLLGRVRKLTHILHSWQRDCQEHRPASLCQAIWRTTVPGHPSCRNFTQPVTSVTEMEAWIQDPSHYDTKEDYQKFHWQDFQHQNLQVLEIFANASSHDDFVQVDIMDAYEALILRPDDHISRNQRKQDCLHNCLPGKTMVYNPWLLHLMKLQQQRQQKQ